MNKRATLLVIVLFSIIFAGSIIVVHAADYNDKRDEILSELEQQIANREEEIQQLQQQAQQYRSEIQTAQKQKVSLQREINVITARINTLEVDIAVTGAQISSATLQITQITEDITVKETKINKTIERMAAILRTLNREDNETLLEMVLKNDALSDAFSSYDYLSQLSDALGDELIELRELKIVLEKQRQKVKSRQEKLKTLNTQLNSQHRVVEGQRTAQSNILRETRGREANYQNLLTKTEEQEQAIQKEIFELEDELRRTLDPSTVPAPRAGVLEWPHGGILTQHYGSTSETGFKNNVYAFHNGLDISAGFGTTVTAARDGVVSAIGDDGRYAYGKWITIKHDNGLSTMYAHMSGWNAVIGQTVKAGSIIGFEGSTGFSTGSHLHFTVYVTSTLEFLDRWYGLLPLGATLDPFDYL